MFINWSPVVRSSSVASLSPMTAVCLVIPMPTMLLHAIADALLGAVALGDIGKHFPDNDPAYKGADSRVLLRSVVARVRAAGGPLAISMRRSLRRRRKMAPHIEQMRQNIASDCAVEVDCIGIKATTTEKLGFTGRGEGIAAQAVALLTVV